MSSELPDLAVIGGSGLYALLEDAHTVEVDTPYGAPSSAIHLTEVTGRPVAFLARHGPGHRYPAHRINYRANLWALRSVGVRRVVAPCAVGSLRPDLGPGSLVLPDQLVDRTSGRVQTYFDAGACHIAFADPYCPELRRQLHEGFRSRGAEVVDGGAMVVIDGPRFSTRAESQSYAASGWTLVNMTGHPEAVLARELALCYAPVALVTDLDAGVESGAGVDQASVFAVFAENIERLRTLLLQTVPDLSGQHDCLCVHAHDGIELPIELP